MMKLNWVLLTILIVFMPFHAFGIGYNDGVTATAALNSRATPSTSGTILDTISQGTTGLVVGGPSVANGYTWWQISWATDPLNPGWSVQDYLSVVPPSANIYTDYIWPGWSNSPQPNMTLSFTSPVVRAGTYGIQASASSSASIYLQTEGFNTTGEQTFRFSILNANGNNYAFYVALCDATGAPIKYLQIGDYTGAGQVYQGGWYDIVIPLADLQAAGQTVSGIILWVDSAANFYLDEVSFSTTTGSSYWTQPTVSSVIVSCSPTPVPINGLAECTNAVTGTGNPESSVTWYVNGVQGGNAAVGTIPSGYVSPFYNAPSAVPNSATVTVTATLTLTATSVLDPTKTGSATLTIVNPYAGPPPPTITAIQADSQSPAYSQVQASDAVFTDAMWTGWSIGVSGQATADPTSDTLYRGTAGMQVQTTAPYASVQLSMQPGFVFNTTGYSSLSLVLNLGTYESESLTISLLNSSGGVIQPVSLANYTPTLTLDSSYAYRWQPISIPLIALGAVNANVYGIQIQSAAPATFFLDDVMFQPAGGCNAK